MSALASLVTDTGHHDMAFAFANLLLSPTSPGVDKLNSHKPVRFAAYQILLHVTNADILQCILIAILTTVRRFSVGWVGNGVSTILAMHNEDCFAYVTSPALNSVYAGSTHTYKHNEITSSW